MTCTTCGRENPPHLTFCQECGQRLGPRIAPPTPPIGLQGSEPSPNDAAPRNQTALGGVAAAVIPQPSPQPPPLTTAPKKCRVCDTMNSAGLRYCTSCGSTLEPAEAQPKLSPHAATIADLGPPAAMPAAASAPAIAPIRMVDVGAPPEAARSCPRCRGVVDPGAQFCKFCGAALGEDAGRSSPSRPMPAAPAANGGGASRPATVPLAQQQPVPSASPIAPSPSPIASSPQPPPVASKAVQIVSAPSPAISVASPATSTPQNRDASLAPPTPFNPMPIPSAAMPPPQPERSVRAPVRGKLVVIAKSGADGPSYPIGDTLDVGRVEGNIIVAEDPYLSPRHVRIVYQNGKMVLRDLASTNGVFLRLAPSRHMDSRRTDNEVAVPLEDQDLILVGQQVLRFEIVKDAESGLGPAMEHGTLLFGSPAAPRYARLGQRTVEGVTRDVYYVRKMETVLGRESGDLVFTEDPFLSRRHAAVRVLEGAPRKFALVDLGSSNGTFLRIKAEVDLVPGDHFRVGQQLFRVDFET